MYSYYVSVFLLLCVFCSGYSLSLCSSVFCLSVCTVLLPPGFKPIAVNKIYMISYNKDEENDAEE